MVTDEVVPPKYTGVVQRPDRKEWYVEGLLHRLDAPAIEWDDGSRTWYFKGKQHRLGGLPAYEGSEGTRAWYVDGRLHRIGGPAIEWQDGCKYWHFKGNLHRMDGAAKIKTYYVNEWLVLTWRIDNRSSIILLY